MAQGRSVSIPSFRNKAPPELNLFDDDYVGVPDREDPNLSPTTPTNPSAKAEEINRNLKDTHRYKSNVMQLIASTRIPSRPTDLVNRLGQLRLSFSLLTVTNLIANQQLEQAMKEAQKVLKSAQSLNNTLSVARCHYWMGRIEFEKNNLEAAHDDFLAARPCLEDGDHPEGETLQFYLEVSGGGVSDEYRNRVLLQHNRALINCAQAEEPSRPHGPLPRKRKREAQSWRIVLRPASEKQSRRQKKQMGFSSPKPTEKLNEWLVYDTPDLPIRPKRTSNAPKPVRASNGHTAHDTAEPSEPSRQRKDYLEAGTANDTGAGKPSPLEGMEDGSTYPWNGNLYETAWRVHPIC
ncbi:uncharacterized protein N7482_006759 [Penicillium canariense]|uniref:Uncharacterized protein n=1 Tax=Penicillium canariense TaxID=189055 RepID=A0A9W9LJ91_9EURO|nr:uncharacterized protein N7482_006759 [Penicillium canariense]KAJ5159755.1 hypothetical protein N7482_006759 [Penicillium canariense]